jgi:hypothetical protein
MQLSLEDRAAIYLEESHVSGDAMIQMDHDLDELSEEWQGSFYLHDLLAGFVRHLSKK